MFPIPWNKAYRKKDGTLVTMEDIAGGGGGGGGGSLSFKIKEVEIPVYSNTGRTYYKVFEPDEGYVPLCASYEYTGSTTNVPPIFSSVATRQPSNDAPIEWVVALLSYDGAINTGGGIAYVLEVEI